jgi:hypothetical protein
MGPRGPQGAEQTHIEVGELLMLHQLPVGTPLKHRQLRTEQQIVRYRKTTLGPLADNRAASRARAARLSWLAWEKLITSSKRLKSPICDTRTTVCSSSCQKSVA